MKVKVLGCYGGIAPGQGMTSFLVNDTVALDAGGLSFALPVDRQAMVKDVFISHAHLDHTCCLPFLIDNSFASPGFSLRIYGIHEVVTAADAFIKQNPMGEVIVRLDMDKAAPGAGFFDKPPSNSSMRCTCRLIP